MLLQRSALIFGLSCVGILMDGFGFVNDVREYIRMFHKQVGEDFSVERYICLFQSEHELTVGESLLFDSFPYAHDPERAHIAFPVFATGKRVLPGMQIRLAGDPYEAAFGHPVAGIGFHQFLMFCVTGDSSFDSHIENSYFDNLCIDIPSDDACDTGSQDLRRTILPALVRFIFRSSDVARSLHTVHDFAVFGDTEPFGCYFFGLHFGHIYRV